MFGATVEFESHGVTVKGIGGVFGGDLHDLGRVGLGRAIDYDEGGTAGAEAQFAGEVSIAGLGGSPRHRDFVAADEGEFAAG